MTLAEQIAAWQDAMSAALAAYSEAQANDMHAQFALDDTRSRTERRIRAGTQDDKKKPTEAAIALAVAGDADVITDSYAALDARITLRAAENAVETQKAIGRAISWRVQLECRTASTLAA
jgi:hypothetical protein